MATIWEPPALLSLAAVLGATGGALYYALRPALRGDLPVVTNERDEVWGAEDPPPPPKRPYVYPADRAVEVPAPPPEILVAPSFEPEPQPAPEAPEVLVVAPIASVAPVTPQSDDDDEEELSLADLFRARRRPQPRPQITPSQPDATPKD